MEILDHDIEVVDIHKKIIADVIPKEIGTTESDIGGALDETLRDGKIRTSNKPNPQHGPRQIVVPIRAETGAIEGAVVMEYTSIYDEAMGRAAGTGWVVAAAAGCGTVIALLLGLFAAKSIIAPLKELTCAAGAFASNQAGITMPPARGDEIGELIAAFNSMMERRRLAKKELMEARDELELRVEERTAALAAANEQLVRDVAEQKLAQEELSRVHHQLLEASREAGKAEVATNVLHNVGNVLNSVNYLRWHGAQPHPLIQPAASCAGQYAARTARRSHRRIHVHGSRRDQAAPIPPAIGRGARGGAKDDYRRVGIARQKHRAHQGHRRHAAKLRQLGRRDPAGPGRRSNRGQSADECGGPGAPRC